LLKVRQKANKFLMLVFKFLESKQGSTLEGNIATRVVGGYGMLTEPMIAAGLITGVPTMYSPAGQRALDMLLRSRPDLMKQAGGMLTGASPQVGAVLAPSVINQYNRAERMPPQLRFPTDLPTD
jgi:hypothetical protein